MSAKLKPCPFCGGEVKIHPNEVGSGGQHVGPWAVYCNTCRLQAFTDDPPDAVAKAWNTRTHPMTDQLHDDLARALEFHVQHCPDCGGSGMKSVTRGNPLEQDCEQCQWCFDGQKALSRYREAKDGEGQYRPLVPGEVIQEGDQYRHVRTGEWTPHVAHCGLIGCKFDPNDDHLPSRRPIRKEQQ